MEKGHLLRDALLNCYYVTNQRFRGSLVVEDTGFSYAKFCNLACSDALSFQIQKDQYETE
jgi:hypothetical protein